MNTLVPIKRNGHLRPSLFEFPSMDTWFNDIFADTITTKPSVNVIENDTDFIIDVATPGFSKSDFNIELNGDKLEISAESTHENNEENVNYRKREFSYSSFKRSFTLPQHAIVDKISADYVDGILKVSIPKQENKSLPNSRRIEIG